MRIMRARARDEVDDLGVVDELDRVRTSPASEDRALQRTLEALRASRSDSLSVVRAEAIAQRAASAARIAPTRAFLDSIVRSRPARTVFASTVLVLGMMGAGVAGALPEPIQRGVDRVAEIMGIDRGRDGGAEPPSTDDASDEPDSGAISSSGPRSSEVEAPAVPSVASGPSAEAVDPPEHAEAPARAHGPPAHAGESGPPPHAGRPGPPPHAASGPTHAGEPGPPPHAQGSPHAAQPGPPPAASGPPPHAESLAARPDAGPLGAEPSGAPLPGQTLEPPR